MSHFNLIDEEWIPVRFLNGRRAELGISDTLLRAKEISAIEDQSPLVVAALYRFLLAVLYRALEGPTDIEQAKELFRSGLPAAKITEYLEKWRYRFWLFDEEFPFGQVPDFTPKNWRSWSTLAAEHNADNAKVLFDHLDNTAPGLITSSATVRWMLATQTFAVSAGKSELSHTGTAPSATAVMVLPIGLNLQDTLIFALVPQNREIVKDDRPCWEQDVLKVKLLMSGNERAICGLADRYTWPSRSIRLEHHGSNRVEKLAFASGVECANSDQADPMLAYRIDPKLGILPIQFRERGFWRSFDSLIPDGTKLPPQVMSHIAEVGRTDKQRFPRSILVLGQSNDKAKINFWRMERFILPGALAGDKYIKSDIRRFLETAETGDKQIYIACYRYATALLRKGGQKPDKSDIKNFIASMTPISVYWSLLEPSFHDALHNFTIDCNPDEIEVCWLQAVRAAISKAWEQHRIAVQSGDAWTIRALVKSEQSVTRKINELTKKIDEFNRALKTEEV